MCISLITANKSTDITQIIDVTKYSSIKSQDAYFYKNLLHTLNDHVLSGT